jgi:hypothetical protein
MLASARENMRQLAMPGLCGRAAAAAAVGALLSAAADLCSHVQDHVVCLQMTTGERTQERWTSS